MPLPRHAALRERRIREREVRHLLQSSAEVRIVAPVDTQSEGFAGGNDPVTGEWGGYGLVGWTRLGEGFRVRG